MRSAQGFLGHHELVLQLTDTSVAELPDDLLRHLRHVTALTLDLRRNRLINLSPAVLYRNGSDWRTAGTQLVKGQTPPPPYTHRRTRVHNCAPRLGQVSNAHE